jgi:RND family efflux transporter MFP subunit
MLAYTKITAPFDGVITKRSADPGALIQSGISSDTQPLLRVSDNYHLRLDFPVTVDYVKDIHVGDSVAVRVDSLGGKILTGKISRFTSSVDDKTRTMTTEIEVPNPDLQLVPGMYASVVLELDRHPGALAIPTEAVSGGSTPVVFVVNDRDEVEKRPVKLGLETSDKYEVLSGLSEGERVVIGNHTEFSEGEKVEPKPVQLSMTNEN